MAIWTFNSAPAGKPMIMDTLDGIDVAARYFVYKLYEATGGYPMQSAALYGIGESAATISRAVERGWVVLQDAKAKPLERKAADGDWRAKVDRVDRPVGTKADVLTLGP